MPSGRRSPRAIAAASWHWAECPFRWSLILDRSSAVGPVEGQLPLEQLRGPHQLASIGRPCLQQSHHRGNVGAPIADEGVGVRRQIRVRNDLLAKTPSIDIRQVVRADLAARTLAPGDDNATAVKPPAICQKPLVIGQQENRSRRVLGREYFHALVIRSGQIAMLCDLARIPYLSRKPAIAAALLRCAQQGQTIFYGELGNQVGIPARGPWKAILDEIAREETSVGRPDITFLVINRQTGLPGQIGFKPAKPPTPEQRRMADAVLQNVFAYHRRA